MYIYIYIYIYIYTHMCVCLQKAIDTNFIRFLTTQTNDGLIYTGRFIMFSVITNIYNKKAKGPTLLKLFTTTGKLKKFFF